MNERPARSRLRLRDLVDEALASLTERPGRSVLTALGTVVGTGTLVAVLGLAASTTAQVSTRFDAVAATEVHVSDARATADDDPAGPFPADADQRAEALNGVTAAGVRWTPVAAQQPVHGAPIGADPGVRLTVVAASAGYLPAADAHVANGRTFDAFHDHTAQLVAVLGSAAAGQLGITSADGQPAVFVDGIPLTVIGILDDTPRAPDLLLSVVVPRGTAERLWGAPTPDDGATALITTTPGAAIQVASEAAVALRPDRPALLSVVPPPDPRQLRQAVDADLTTLFLALAGICLLVGTIGIAGVTLVAVMERVPEIGLRRSVGATRAHIVGQVLTESAMLATLGGLVGTSLGIVIVVALCVLRTWSPVIAPASVLAGPLLGLVTGLVAGAYPAVRAGHVEPVSALRD